MKKAYRIISVLAAAAITAASLALTGCGDTAPTDEEVTIETEGQAYLSANALYTYTLNNDNTATLIAYNGDAASVVLNRIDGRYTITAIAEGAFAGNTSIKKIELDRDNGIYTYEIEFYADGYEYDYEISREDGKILSHKKEQEYKTPANTSRALSEKQITAEEAKLLLCSASASGVVFSVLTRTVMGGF